jgi:hypothetical protein
MYAVAEGEAIKIRPPWSNALQKKKPPTPIFKGEEIGGQRQASSVSILCEGLEGTAWERSFYLDSAAKLSGNWNLVSLQM